MAEESKELVPELHIQEHDPQQKKFLLTSPPNGRNQTIMSYPESTKLEKGMRIVPSRSALGSYDETRESKTLVVAAAAAKMDRASHNYADRMLTLSSQKSPKNLIDSGSRLSSVIRSYKGTKSLISEPRAGIRNHSRYIDTNLSEALQRFE